jgi:antitoxin YefM
METLPLSEVKARLSEIAEEVERTHQRVNITRNGRSYVVLISAADLESLEATLELLSDPDALDRVAQAQADLAAGRQTTQTQLAALMEQRRQQERPGA